MAASAVEIPTNLVLRDTDGVLKLNPILAASNGAEDCSVVERTREVEYINGRRVNDPEHRQAVIVDVLAKFAPDREKALDLKSYSSMQEETYYLLLGNETFVTGVITALAKLKEKGRRRS